MLLGLTELVILVAIEAVGFREVMGTMISLGLFKLIVVEYSSTKAIDLEIVWEELMFKVLAVAMIPMKIMELLAKIPTTIGEAMLAMLAIM